MKHSTRTPSKSEARRIEDMLRLGCCACASLNIWSPAHECHHLLYGNKRMGHIYTIPLCRGHHRGAWDSAQKHILAPPELVSIADGRKAFTRIYPSEKELWQTVQKRLHLPALWPVSKVLPRRITITERNL